MSNPLGWSYPAGCSGPPEPPWPSQLQEDLWELLENAGVPEDVAKQAYEIVEKWERDAEVDPPAWPESLRESARQMEVEG